MKCSETAGFLIRSACKRPATGTCMQCQKPVCTEHQRLIDAKLVCIACFKGWAKDRPEDEKNYSRINSRRSNYDYYDPYLYHQYYYSSYDPYYDTSHPKSIT